MIIAGVLSGLLGAMGLGGGGVLILYLTLFENVPQLKAQGINLMFFIPCALVATVVYYFKKQISPKSLLPYIAAGLAGAVIGTYVSGALGTDLMRKLFGGALVLMGVKEVFQKAKNKSETKNALQSSKNENSKTYGEKN